MRKLAAITAALLGLAGAFTLSSAQDDAPPPPDSAGVTWPSDALDQMLGPIALYPDPLIGLILPASTQPAQIVAADRYLTDGGDPGQVEQQGWDASVQGLAHYPEVLKWMDDNLTWTTQLGEAFANQQQDVMDSIQRLRGKAQALGNLQSTPQENVAVDDGMIDIEPVSPEEIYVPDYQPTIIYEQPGVYCTFGVGFPIGLWLGFDWDWRRHSLIHWGPGHERPGDWWRRSPPLRRKEIDSHPVAAWRPKVPTGNIVDRGYPGRPQYSARPAPAPKPRGESRPVTRTPAAPRETPRVTPHETPRVTPHETPRAPVGRAPAIQRPAPAARPVERSASESAFGGAASSHEVRAASSRGAESRGGSGGGSSGGGGGGRSGGGSKH
jgi:hypothetical protein